MNSTLFYSTSLFNSTVLLLETHSYTAIDWLKVIGTLLTLVITVVLFILKIREYIQDRIRLRIEIKDASFFSLTTGDTRTTLNFIADIRNVGKQPTTISRIEFFSDNLNFDDLWVLNKIFCDRAYSFEKIRIEANDRIEEGFFVEKSVELENCNELNCSLKFETSHKTIIKKFKANRKNNL